jgi:hypothetical protein
MGIFLLSLIFLGLPFPGYTQARGSSSSGVTRPWIYHSTRSTRGQPIYPPRQNLPLYNPYFSIYFGPLYEPYDEPCYYDEDYGQWVGPCDTSLDTPGYSITIPNRIR